MGRSNRKRKKTFFTEETADAEEREGTEEALFFAEKEDAEGTKEADAAHAETHSESALTPMTSNGNATSGSMVIMRFSSRYQGELMIFGSAPTNVTVHTYTSVTSRNAAVNAITSRRRSLRRGRDGSDSADKETSAASEHEAVGRSEAETTETAASETKASASAEKAGATVETAAESESEERTAARRKTQTKAATVPAISNNANKIAGKPSRPSVKQNEIDSHKFLDG